MPIDKSLFEFSEFFTLAGSSQVYGVAAITHSYKSTMTFRDRDIVWKYCYSNENGHFWESTRKYDTAGVFRNRHLKIRNIQIIHKSG